ncbi:hypothetical protein KBB05_01860 [Patescibacteria group bacterium]|nr:hypothetical protein [Patescibacteria group bacterium]
MVQQEEVAKNQEQLYYINDPYDILSSSQKTELIQYAKRLSCKLVVSV